MILHALTISQPWATLVVAGVKKYESRSWAVAPRKLPKVLAIHAGKGIDRMVRAHITTRDHNGLLVFREPYADALYRAGYSIADPWQREYDTLDVGALRKLPLGAVVGVARTAPAMPADQITDAWKRGTIDELEYRLGDYSAGRYAWPLPHVMSFGTPVPCKGMLGLWPLPPLLAFDVLAMYAQSREDAA